MTDEQRRKRAWLSLINANISGWVDDDQVGRSDSKTADLVNRKEKFAIELKRGMGVAEGDHRALFNRIGRHIVEADEKFANYPDFKTVLVFELDTNVPMLYHSLIVSFLHRRKNSARRIGGFLLMPNLHELKILSFYFENETASRDYVPAKERLEVFLNRDIKTLSG